MRLSVSAVFKGALKETGDACAIYPFVSQPPSVLDCVGVGWWVGCRIRTITEKAYRYAVPLAPYPFGGLDDDAELALLVLGAQGIAEDRRGEPALRAEGQPLQRHEVGSLPNAGLELFGSLTLGSFVVRRPSGGHSRDAFISGFAPGAADELVHRGVNTEEAQEPIEDVSR